MTARGASAAPTGEPLLDSRTALIETWMRGRSKRRVTEWLTKDHAKAVGVALESLCERGVAVEDKRKALGGGIDLCGVGHGEARASRTSRWWTS
ncbi:hypothetical protein ACIA6D_44180 [Streptomyces cacaoi]